MYLINASDQYHPNPSFPTPNPHHYTTTAKKHQLRYSFYIKIEIINEGNEKKRLRLAEHRQQKGGQRVAGNRFIGAQVQAKLYEQSYSSQ